MADTEDTQPAYWSLQHELWDILRIMGVTISREASVASLLNAVRTAAISRHISEERRGYTCCCIHCTLWRERKAKEKTL